MPPVVVIRFAEILGQGVDCNVVAVSRPDPIATAAAVDNIVAPASDDAVVAATAVDRVVTPDVDDPIVTVQAIDQVVTTGALDDVVVVRTQDVSHCCLLVPCRRDRVWTLLVRN